MHSTTSDGETWMCRCRLNGLRVCMQAFVSCCCSDISILHCLTPPPCAWLPHANKSLLSLFDFANANLSLRENRAATAPDDQTSV